MKKVFWAPLLSSLMAVPILASAAILPIVQCGNATGDFTNPCQLSDFFAMIIRLYGFAVYYISLPVAAIAIIIGGLLFLLSGLNPSWADRGKKILLYTVIAIALILGSWLIINVVMLAIGYVPAGGGNWWSF